MRFWLDYMYVYQKLIFAITTGNTKGEKVKSILWCTYRILAQFCISFTQNSCHFLISCLLSENIQTLTGTVYWFPGSLESLLALISIRFGPSLRYIELPIELITHTVLHELAAKCPNLTHMLLDFSTGKLWWQELK